MSPHGIFTILIFMLTPLAGVSAAVPQPGEIKTFKDWAVGCDNGGICKAVSLIPDQSDSFDDWQGPITVVRTAETNETLKIRVLVEALDIDRYRMKVDGQLVDTGPVVKGDYPIEIVGQDAEKVVQAIARGNNLQVVGPNDENLTQISLAGSSAALRFIDAKQKRAGTKTALIAKGRLQFSASTTSIPLIPVDQWDDADRVPDTAEIVELVENSSCKDERFGVVEDQAYAMGARAGNYRALVLISCGSGAYNFSSTAFIGEYQDGDKDEARKWSFEPAKFDIPPAWGGDGRTPLLVNASWEGQDQILSSFAKGRGLGDCGNSESYVWDGSMFRMIEATSMTECRGGYEWITTWRAQYAKSEETASSK
ncbi:MAG: DUF1176 domain-containing protein [Parasphingorhabdus sp.]